ncbi:MAG TPA: 3-oxoacyl-ACP reductase family protein [candidate division Zixibacteria bacterium]|nr:3-oxoacyl-ACP reductase family protein [candidate division Zixibacteria bacterium]
MTKFIDLSGQTALVTGGSRGIGRATAVYLAKAGADVAFSYAKNEKAAQKTLEEIEKTCQKALAVKADVSKFSEVEKLVETTVKKFNRIDILVTNAGIWEEAGIEKMTPEKLAKTVETNLYGTFYPITLCVPYMKKQHSGNIITVSSTAGQRGEAFHSHYAATKGAVISLTKSLAPELAPFGIRANCVAPGWVDTDMSHAALTSKDRKKILSLIPVGRAAEAEEIAGAILFLASGLSTFVVGEILNVNGGAVLIG